MSMCVYFKHEFLGDRERGNGDGVVKSLNLPDVMNGFFLFSNPLFGTKIISKQDMLHALTDKKTDYSKKLHSLSETLNIFMQ